MVIQSVSRRHRAVKHRSPPPLPTLCPPIERCRAPPAAMRCRCKFRLQRPHTRPPLPTTSPVDAIAVVTAASPVPPMPSNPRNESEPAAENEVALPRSSPGATGQTDGRRRQRHARTTRIPRYAAAAANLAERRLRGDVSDRTRRPFRRRIEYISRRSAGNLNGNRLRRDCRLDGSSHWWSVAAAEQ